MLDELSLHTALELHHEIQSLKRAVAVLKERVRQVEKRQRQPTEPALPPNARALVRSMVAIVCGCSQVTSQQIVSDQRDARTTMARQTACWLARRFGHRTYAEIGLVLRRDHTTVLHNVRRVDEVVIRLGRCPGEDTPQAWAEMLLTQPWPGSRLVSSKKICISNKE